MPRPVLLALAVLFGLPALAFAMFLVGKLAALLSYGSIPSWRGRETEMLFYCFVWFAIFAVPAWLCVRGLLKKTNTPSTRE